MPVLKIQRCQQKLQLVGNQCTWGWTSPTPPQEGGLAAWPDRQYRQFLKSVPTSDKEVGKREGHSPPRWPGWWQVQEAATSSRLSALISPQGKWDPERGGTLLKDAQLVSSRGREAGLWFLGRRTSLGWMERVKRAENRLLKPKFGSMRRIQLGTMPLTSLGVGASGKPPGFRRLPLDTKMNCRWALMMCNRHRTQTLLPSAGPTSWATRGPELRRVPRSVTQCSVVAILKFLIVLSLDVCVCCKWSPTGKWAWAGTERVPLPLGCEISVDPPRAGDSKQVQGEHARWGGCWQPGEALPSVQSRTCFKCKKKTMTFLPPSYLFIYGCAASAQL